MNTATNNLINECKKGNRAAQKELYYLSKDRLKYMALRYCPIIQDAQDAVQNAYLNIFRSIDKFDPARGNFNAWSAKIVANEALQILKKSRKMPIEEIDASLHLSGHETSLNNLTLDEVQTAMQHLKDDQRVVINMHFFEEFTYKEMSKMLELKESSVRSKVTRAKQELQTIWNKINKVSYEFK